MLFVLCVLFVAINLIRLDWMHFFDACLLLCCCCEERERNKRRSEPVKLFSDDEMTSFVSGVAEFVVGRNTWWYTSYCCCCCVFLCCSFFCYFGRFSSLAKINFAHTHNSHTRLNVLLLFLLSVPIFCFSFASFLQVCLRRTNDDHRQASLTHTLIRNRAEHTLTTNRLSCKSADWLL